MDKQKELQSEIEKINSQVEKLNNDRKILIDEMSKLDLDKGDRIKHILKYGGYSTYIINMTDDGILEEHLSEYSKHETVYLQSVIDSIDELSIIANTFEEQQKVFEMFGLNDSSNQLTEGEYDSATTDSYTYSYSFEKFEDLWNDIVEANVSSFVYDW